ncbi:MAG: hypothetical protein RL522_66 [Pseudomonadota bacterium]|jgi:hypothetical protein
MPSDAHRESCDLVETSDDAAQRLALRGWAVLPGTLLGQGVRAALAAFGRIVPQYNGHDTWEVRARPGFETLPYSQSNNGIGAHTEAPVLSPPPRYLALHCKHQARCGGGHTLLADGLQFCTSLVGWDAVLRTKPIDFVATPSPGNTQRHRLQAPLLSDGKTHPIFRFSDNLFRYGDVNPTAEALASPSVRDPQLLELAAHAERFFDTHGTAVLVPDDCLLIWDNHRMMHARSRFIDPARHLTRYWLQ